MNRSMAAPQEGEGGAHRVTSDAGPTCRGSALLGRHVGQGAELGAGAGPARGVRGLPGHPEARDPHLPVRVEEEVLGLDVPVDDAEGGLRPAPEGIDGDPRGLRRGQRAGLGEPVAHRALEGAP